MAPGSSIDVAVVGAGFSGIATAAALRRYGVEGTVLLESGTRYGEFWARNYDRIRLHTAWHDLPDDGGLSDEYPMFKSRLDLLDYFNRYADRHSLAGITRFDSPVRMIRRRSRDPEHVWELDVRDDRLRARYLVVATGFCRIPTLPALAESNSFGGVLIHSRYYRNAKPFCGKRMLVVGSGNSACEIATDLVEGGAASVDLLVYGGRYMIPIERFAAFMHEAREQGMAGPAGVLAVHPVIPGSDEFMSRIAENDAMLRPLAEDMTAFNIETPETGPAYDLIVNNRVPVLDHGAIPLIRSGEITVLRDRIDRLTPTGAAFEQSGARRYDAIILSTGFRPGIETLFDDAVTEKRERNGLEMPKTDHRCRSTVFDRLYFAGFDHSLWGGLSHGLWGFEIAERIAVQLGTFDATLRPSSLAHAPWLAS